MKFKELFKRKKTIKKPNWLVNVLLFAIILGIISALVYDTTVNSFTEAMSAPDEYRSINYYLRQTSLLLVDGISDEELEQIQYSMEEMQLLLNFPCIITVDGNEICNSSNMIGSKLYDAVTDEEISFVKTYWNPETDANAQKLYDYQYGFSSLYSYSFFCNDFYYNPETNECYLGNIEVWKYTGNQIAFIWFGTPFDTLWGKNKLVDTVDLTPADKSLVQGFIHVDNSNNDDYILSIFGITGSVDNGDNVETTYEFEDNVYQVNAKYSNAFMAKETIVIHQYYAIILGISALLIALILGTIKYYRNKATYKIFEYRRQTTNAMAHDLKTPLAIASLSVSNLKENLNVDNERVTYHANEIDDSIRYMDQLICNILSFSNSETADYKIYKENIDVKKELLSYKQNVCEVLKNSNLSLNISGNATIKTDRKTWNQAIFNLIDNAVKYSDEGTTIDVLLSDKSIRFTNTFSGEINNIDKLKEPFVKGNNNRGENSGSGLGLSIAENNLKALGYKLSISCSGNEFVAEIKK